MKCFACDGSGVDTCSQCPCEGSAFIAKARERVRAATLEPINDRSKHWVKVRKHSAFDPAEGSCRPARKNAWVNLQTPPNGNFRTGA
jgi:hypothetical protein